MQGRNCPLINRVPGNRRGGSPGRPRAAGPVRPFQTQGSAHGGRTPDRGREKDAIPNVGTGFWPKALPLSTVQSAD